MFRKPLQVPMRHFPAAHPAPCSHPGLWGLSVLPVPPPKCHHSGSTFIFFSQLISPRLWSAFFLISETNGLRGEL